MARSALAEAKINTNPTQTARSRAPAVPDTCRSPGQREAGPGVAGMPSLDAMENLRHFLDQHQDQDQDRRVAEQDIIAAREEVARTRPPGTERLAAAPHEVAAVDAGW
jgi:hypothetical protein